MNCTECKKSRVELINEIHKIYCTHNLSDDEVLEQIKLILNREMIDIDKIDKGNER